MDDTGKLFFALSYVEDQLESIVSDFRFFIKDEVKKLFDDVIDNNPYNLENGEKLYRGRLITSESDLSEIVEFKNQLKKYRELNDVRRYNNTKIEFEKYLQIYYGPPPSSYSKEGRANPKGINYLYLSAQRSTVIAELRGDINSKINIGSALVKVKNKEGLDLVIIDSSRSMADSEKDKGLYVFVELLLKKYLCKPTNDRDSLDYIPMQVFAEYCKYRKKDGIIYSSSVVKDDISLSVRDRPFNIVLFNSENVHFESSNEYRIENITYDFQINELNN
jgi:hypothetical protein